MKPLGQYPVLLLLLAAAAWPHGRPRALGESRSIGGEAASRLYVAKCARCHGADGTGEEIRTAQSGGPDFTSPGWHRAHTNGQLVASILNGKGAGMPAFAGKMSTAQARELVTYVRSFAANATPPAGGPDGAEDDFEARFRELQAEYERLRRELDKVAPRR